MGKLCPRGKAAAKRSLKYTLLHTLMPTVLRYVKGKSNLAVKERPLKDTLEERDELKKMVRREVGRHQNW